jgi:hypothetical protein
VVVRGDQALDGIAEKSDGFRIGKTLEERRQLEVAVDDFDVVRLTVLEELPASYQLAKPITGRTHLAYQPRSLRGDSRA